MVVRFPGQPTKAWLDPTLENHNYSIPEVKQNRKTKLNRKCFKNEL